MNDEILVRNSFLNVQKVLQILGIGKSTFYEGVRKGIYPKPYKITAQRTAWLAGEILDVVEKIKREQRPELYS